MVNPLLWTVVNSLLWTVFNPVVANCSSTSYQTLHCYLVVYILFQLSMLPFLLPIWIVSDGLGHYIYVGKIACQVSQ